MCGQHRAVLKRKVDGYLQMDEDGGPNNVNVRNRRMFIGLPQSLCMHVRIGMFFDATLDRVPSRVRPVYINHVFRSF